VGEFGMGSSAGGACGFLGRLSSDATPPITNHQPMATSLTT
jgi:hypothetical protein